MTKGDRLTEKDVRQRIAAAIDSIFDDGADAAKLHNALAQGEIEYDADKGDWVCVRGENDPEQPAYRRNA